MIMRSITLLIGLILAVLCASNASAQAMRWTGEICPQGVFIVEGEFESAAFASVLSGAYGTRCPSETAPSGDEVIGTASTHSFQYQENQKLLVSGGLGRETIKLWVQDAVGQKYDLVFDEEPGVQWRVVPMGEQIVGAQNPIKIFVEDNGENSGDWIGIAGPVDGELISRQGFVLAKIVVVTCIMTACLVGLSVVVRAVGERLISVRSESYWVALSFTLLGVLSYFSLALVWVNPYLPSAFFVLFFVFGVWKIFVKLRAGGGLVELLPKAIWVMLSIVILYSGLAFLYVPGFGPDTVENLFFEKARPYDNEIPANYAIALLSSDKPSVGPDGAGWYFTDRGPMQPGLVVFAAPILGLFGWALGYEVIGALLQLSILPAFLCFLRIVGVKGTLQSTMVFATIVSPLLFYNVVYPWPKLLAAGFTFASLNLLWPLLRDGKRIAPLEGILAATSAALALLTHGGSLFVFIGVGACLLIRLGRQLGWVQFFQMLATVVVVYLPWQSYVALVDPHENALVRLHFTDRSNETGDHMVEQIIDSHRKLSPQTWWKYRVENMLKPLGDNATDRLIVHQLGMALNKESLVEPPQQSTSYYDLSHLEDGWIDFITTLRIDQREHLLRSLGWIPILFLLAPFGWMRARPDAKSFSNFASLAAVLTLSWVAWSTLQFYGRETSMTHASFALPFLLIALAGLSTPASLKRAANIIILIGAAITVWIWSLTGPGLGYSRHLSYSFEVPSLQVTSLLAIILGGGLLFKAWRLPEAQNKV